MSTHHLTTKQFLAWRQRQCHDDHQRFLLRERDSKRDKKENVIFCARVKLFRVTSPKQKYLHESPILACKKHVTLNSPAFEVRVWHYMAL